MSARQMLLALTDLCILEERLTGVTFQYSTRQAAFLQQDEMAQPSLFRNYGYIILLLEQNNSLTITGHYQSSWILFKTQRFGDWILFPSSGGTELSRLQDGDRIQSLKRCVLNTRQDDAQNCDSYISIPSSQTYR
jgi:hypothetical protein